MHVRKFICEYAVDIHWIASRSTLIVHAYNKHIYEQNKDQPSTLQS
jgi:hypothetical protein